MIPFHARLNMCPHNLSIIYHVVAQFVLWTKWRSAFRPKAAGRLERHTEGGETETEKEKESWRIAGLARQRLVRRPFAKRHIAHTSAKLETKA